MEFEDKLELIDEKITSTTILSIPKLTPKLTHLNLAHNRIDFLPDSLFLACPNLNHLNLYGNCIQEIPKGIRNLSDLKWLNIGKFCTTKYSQFNLTKKKSYSIKFDLFSSRVANNKIKAIPPQIGYLQKLRHLDLSLNDLTLQSLPNEFFQLSSLERLYLSDNNLESISAEFGKLCNLQILSVR